MRLKPKFDIGDEVYVLTQDSFVNCNYCEVLKGKIKSHNNSPIKRFFYGISVVRNDKAVTLYSEEKYVTKDSVKIVHEAIDLMNQDRDVYQSTFNNYMKKLYWMLKDEG